MTPARTAGNDSCARLSLALATFLLDCWASFQDGHHFPSSLDKLSASYFQKQIFQGLSSVIFPLQMDMKDLIIQLPIDFQHISHYLFCPIVLEPQASCTFLPQGLSSAISTTGETSVF